MDAKYLAEIKEREQAANGENWIAGTVAEKCTFEILEPGADKTFIAEVYYHNDAAFIAHARTDIPALIAEVERLKKSNELFSEENHTLYQQIATLKKALELACEDLAERDYPPKNVESGKNKFVEYFIQQAQEQEGKK